ncbi:amino acid dehydrogenase [Rhizobium rhizosphaerae]|uniref:Amino acid dehydrogenase n=1 Tax=Xaviernesmea rhizosphaerae TaxID=1672749 RepID=A0ABX3PCV9_9HYPH|nr:FAD-dependent oxidoreductase [Xaviernesmea rhizosphaerae]OQP85862.1 amino acid dehydrogenase [Xaviernesmea rhizosphaerae]
MGFDCLVLGGGIVGVSAALHLQARGRAVALIDRTQPGTGTSYGNAGLIERSSVVPYAFPRKLSALFAYGLNRRSDVRYDPKFLARIAPFLLRYWRASAPAPLEASAAALLPLIEASITEHQALSAQAGAEALMRPGGWISVYKSEKGFAAAAREGEGFRTSHGLTVDILDRAAFLALEPAFVSGAERIAGAVHWRDPLTVDDPLALTTAYATLFRDRGGRIIKGQAESLRPDGAGLRVETEEGPVTAREVVIALGPQSAALVSRFGLSVPMAVKRGYHRHYAQAEGALPGRPVVDEDAGYVLAPMRQGLRLTTGIEFAAADSPANPAQLQACEVAARGLLPLGAPVEAAPWMGLRPCLPDMKPLIGPVPGQPGLWCDFGHAHHGLTLGPASGRLLAELITGETPFADPAPFAPARFA